MWYPVHPPSRKCVEVTPNYPNHLACWRGGFGREWWICQTHWCCRKCTTRIQQLSRFVAVFDCLFIIFYWFLCQYVCLYVRFSGETFFNSVSQMHFLGRMHIRSGESLSGSQVVRKCYIIKSPNNPATRLRSFNNSNNVLLLLCRRCARK
jgi:hypothetical protein